MRKLEYWGCVVALTASALGIAPALANDDTITLSCDQYATLFADHASRDDMQVATAKETSAPGKVLVIAAGQKFFMPPRAVDDEGMAPKSVWQRMRDYNTAYSDAFWRCRYSAAVVVDVRR